jgi:hypothetical protein
MVMLDFINQYAQLINVAFLIVIVGWLFQITKVTREASNEKQQSILASKESIITSKDTEITSLKASLKAREELIEHMKSLSFIETGQLKSTIAAKDQEIAAVKDRLSNQAQFHHQEKSLMGLQTELYQKLLTLPADQQTIKTEIEDRLHTLQQEEQSASGNQKVQIAQEKGLLTRALESIKSVDPAVWSTIGTMGIRLIADRLTPLELQEQSKPKQLSESFLTMLASSTIEPDETVEGDSDVSAVNADK